MTKIKNIKNKLGAPSDKKGKNLFLNSKGGFSLIEIFPVYKKKKLKKTGKQIKRGDC